MKMTMILAMLVAGSCAASTSAQSPQAAQLHYRAEMTRAQARLRFEAAQGHLRARQAENDARRAELRARTAARVH